MLVVSSLVSLYYNVIIAWTFYYLSMSFQSPLPWSCDAPQNGPLCQAQVPGGSEGGGQGVAGSVEGGQESLGGPRPYTAPPLAQGGAWSSLGELEAVRLHCQP